ncbi:MAG: 50S ribosomal protein L17, partial [Bacteroidota bacterium]
RHGKKLNHLSRPAAHRKALLSNLAKSLILQKRIHTTVAKAKALKKFVEPILTKAKLDTTHSRRVVFAYFQDKVPVKELFNEVAAKIADRPGGYTRIIKLGTRLGDNAEMCMIELVDYNELLQKANKPDKTKTRRGRRSKTKAQEVVASGAHKYVTSTSSTTTDETSVNTADQAPQVQATPPSQPDAPAQEATPSKEADAADADTSQGE